jgi:undecaprenyl-diphosphatase
MFEANWPSWDSQWLIFLNQATPEELLWVWAFFSHKWLQMPLYVGLTFWLFRYRPRQAVWVFAFVGLAVGAADRVSSGAIKPLFERPRPCHVQALKPQLRLWKQNCGGKYGFVSSHAANAFAFVTVWWRIVGTRGSLPVWLLLWAVLVSYSRVALGVHYPLDCLVGGLVGWFCGTLACQLYAPLHRFVRKWGWLG